VSPGTVTAGQPLTVAGAGCQPGVQVQIIFDTEPAGGLGTARADGSFRFTFVPTLAPRTTTTVDVYAICPVDGAHTPAVKLTIRPANDMPFTG
jgi:hypothetical protein